MGIDMSPCANDSGAAPMASAGDAPPAVLAMFVEEQTVAVEGIDLVNDTELVHVVVKRVWLLDGHFTQAQLESWAADIAQGRRTTIDAMVNFCIVDVAQWPALTEYVGVGLGMVTRQAFDAVMIAIGEAKAGRPERANAIMQNYRRQTGVQTLP